MKAPTPDEINSLPEHLRAWIHALETRCDHSGELRELVDRRDQVEQLAARVVELEKPLAREIVIEDSGGFTDKVRITDGNGKELRGVTAVEYVADARGRIAPTSLVLRLCPFVVATRLRARGFTAAVNLEELRSAFEQLAGDMLDDVPAPAPENANAGSGPKATEP